MLCALVNKADRTGLGQMGTAYLHLPTLIRTFTRSSKHADADFVEMFVEFDSFFIKNVFLFQPKCTI